MTLPACCYEEFIPDGDLLPLPHRRTQLCHYALRLTQPVSLGSWNMSCCQISRGVDVHLMRKHWSRSVDSVMSFWGCLWRNLVAIDQVFQGNIGNVQLWRHISHPSGRKSTNPPLRSAQNSAAWSRFKQLVSYGFEHLDTSIGVGWRVGGWNHQHQHRGKKKRL